MEKLNIHSSSVDNFIQNHSQLTVNMNTTHKCCNDDLNHETTKIDIISSNFEEIHSKMADLQYKMLDSHHSFECWAINKYKNTLDWNCSFNQSINK